MTVALELRGLINKIEQLSDAVLSKAAQTSPELFNIYTTGIAKTLVDLEKVAEGQEGQFSLDMLDELVSLANTLDKSDDLKLRKQASVLDELLLTIAAPKNSLAQAKRVKEEEFNKLRDKYRTQQREDVYAGPKKALDKQNLIDKAREAVDNKVKNYNPLEAPLQTRYPPDMPGGHQTRVGDSVYQDVVTGKIYDYKSGYTTNKGNKVPGSAVENQIPDLGNYQDAASLFETRESMLSRNADDSGLSNVFNALKKKGHTNVDNVKLAGAKELRTLLLKIAEEATSGDDDWWDKYNELMRWREDLRESGTSVPESEREVLSESTKKLLSDYEETVARMKAEPFQKAEPTEGESKAEHDIASRMHKTLEGLSPAALLAIRDMSDEEFNDLLAGLGGDGDAAEKIARLIAKRFKIG